MVAMSTADSDRYFNPAVSLLSLKTPSPNQTQLIPLHIRTMPDENSLRRQREDALQLGPRKKVCVLFSFGLKLSLLFACV
jgi:hypothetical protein